MDSSLKKGPNRELRWLPGLGPSYTSDVRAFVLRTHMRKRRRLTAPQSHETDDEVDGRGLPHTPPEVSQYLMSPSSYLGQGRTDPFAVLAQTLTATDYRFFNHYIGDSLLELYGLSSKTSFHPPRHFLINRFLSDECSLAAVLAFGASSIDALGRSATSRCLVAHYRASAIRKISIRISQRSGEVFDPPFIGIIGLISSTIEARAHVAQAEELSEMWTHVRGLKCLIETAGGWQTAAATSKEVSFCLHWCVLSFLPSLLSVMRFRLAAPGHFVRVGASTFSNRQRRLDILVSGALSIDATPVASWVDTPPSRVFALVSRCAHKGNSQFEIAEEFIALYVELRKVAVARLAASPSQTAMSHVFSQSHHIQRLLAKSKGVTLSPIVPILYINILLWETETWSVASTSQLRDFYTENLKRTDVDREGGVELLFWGLMFDFSSNSVLRPDWMRLVGRFMHVVITLNTATRALLAKTLLEFVTALHPDHESEWWSGEALREIVHNELQR